MTLTGSDVTISQTEVTSSPTFVGPVSAIATIASQRPRSFPPHTVVEGTLTNTGGSIGGFTIELQANSGAVTTASAYDVQPGQTMEWATIFPGQGTARILRTTTLRPSPKPRACSGS